MHVDCGYPNPPIELSTLLGDALHNFRCAWITSRGN
jgi:hypothetical protein